VSEVAVDLERHCSRTLSFALHYSADEREGAREGRLVDFVAVRIVDAVAYKVAMVCHCALLPNACGGCCVADAECVRWWCSVSKKTAHAKTSKNQRPETTQPPQNGGCGRIRTIHLIFHRVNGALSRKKSQVCDVGCFGGHGGRGSRWDVTQTGSTQLRLHALHRIECGEPHIADLRFFQQAFHLANNKDE
jgi:hypothetical protein